MPTHRYTTILEGVFLSPPPLFFLFGGEMRLEFTVRLYFFIFFVFIFFIFVAEVAAPVLAAATASTGARLSSPTRADDIQIDYSSPLLPPPPASY